jgi:hypothetical protein
MFSLPTFSSYIAIALEATPPLSLLTKESGGNNNISSFNGGIGVPKLALNNNGAGGPSAAASAKNMLRRDVVTAINDLHSFIMHNMTIELPDGSYHFGHDICSRSPLCPVSNAAVQIFFETYFSEKVQNNKQYVALLILLAFSSEKTRELAYNGQFFGSSKTSSFSRPISMA